MKDESLSYQYHVVKDETIRLLSGALEMDLEVGGERNRIRLAPGECLHIVPGMKHRMTALEDCDVLEVSTLSSMMSFAWKTAMAELILKRANNLYLSYPWKRN